MIISLLVGRRSEEEYDTSFESLESLALTISLLSWRIHQEETPDLAWKTIEDFQRDTEDIVLVFEL